ncbi:MAG: prepilin-type N-terminal cleavage/methylation domain-containing protein [Caulobacterales bacterium]|uniref:prepilin-type N-terminal cleavage/methylation domain-containing protein n=1 Tax=Glycocaulis sp. TaxID=1969725 RepID=UPI003F9FAB47
MVRKGFSLIEVLAAVALMALAIMPLYQLQRTLADAALRMSRAGELADMEQSALGLIATINPDQMAEGTETIGAWTMSWTSERIAYNPAPDGMTGRGIYSISLYEVTVTLRRDDREHSFTVRQLGWTQTRDMFGDVMIP